MRIAIFSRPLFGLTGWKVAEILQAEIIAPTAAITLGSDPDFPEIYRELRQIKPQLSQLSPIAELENLITANPFAVFDARNTAVFSPDLIFQKLGSAQVLAWQAKIQENKLSALIDLGIRAKGDDISQQKAGSTGLVAVISEAEKTLSLTGLRGLSAKLGFAQNLARNEIIALDQQAKNWLTEIGLTDLPGYGAANGYAAVIAALGGRIISAFDYLVELQSGIALLQQADLALVISHRFDFGYHGGEAVHWALSNAQIPVVVAAPGAEMSRREARSLGVEEVWNLGHDLDALSAFTRSFSRLWA